LNHDSSSKPNRRFPGEREPFSLQDERNHDQYEREIMVPSQEHSFIPNQMLRNKSELNQSNPKPSRDHSWQKSIEFPPQPKDEQSIKHNGSDVDVSQIEKELISQAVSGQSLLNPNKRKREELPDLNEHDAKDPQEDPFFPPGSQVPQLLIIIRNESPVKQNNCHSSQSQHLPIPQEP